MSASNNKKYGKQMYTLITHTIASYRHTSQIMKGFI